KRRVIAILEGIDQFGEILKTISSFCPVRVRMIEQWHKYRAFMVTGLLLFVIMIWATSPVVVIPLSLVTGSVIVWVFFWMRRQPSVSESTKRIAWVYWVFFVICVVKLFVVVEGPERGPTSLGKIVANMLVFSPCTFLIFGWVRWWRARSPQY